MSELVTIGETMVAMLPQSHGPLRYVSEYKTKIVGAESNVAVGISKLGHTSSWIGRVGDDEFGKMVLREMQADTVDCKNVIKDNKHRTGIMFKQIGVEDTSVFYYREHSAASYLTPDDINENQFLGAKILHISGITPVLSDSCFKAVNKAIDIAKEKEIKFSFDPNIRKKLWNGKDFNKDILELVLKADIIELGVEEAKSMMGMTEDCEIINYIHSYNKDAVIALKKGSNGATVANNANIIAIPPFPCKCIETIGAGDAFNAGFLAGMLEEKSLDLCGKMGAIAGAMATEVPGDVEGQPDKKQMFQKLYNISEINR